VLGARPAVLDPLLELMDDAAFRRDVEALGGYSASEMGRLVPPPW
jgi:hypothetical protein